MSITITVEHIDSVYNMQCEQFCIYSYGTTLQSAMEHFIYNLNTLKQDLNDPSMKFSHDWNQIKVKLNQFLRP